MTAPTAIIQIPITPPLGTTLGIAQADDEVAPIEVAGAEAEAGFCEMLLAMRLDLLLDTALYHQLRRPTLPWFCRTIE